MSRTLRDVVFECENFEHSREHYEILKETAEIMLAEQYLANQRFMAENAESMKNITFTEGYLMESKTAEDLTPIEESVGEKVKGLLTKIGNGLKKLWQTICDFFTKTIPNFIKKKGGKKRKIVDVNKLTPEQKTKYVEKIQEIATTGNYNFKIDGNGLKGFVNGYKLGRNKACKINVTNGNAVSAKLLWDVFNRLSSAETAHAVKSLNNSIENAMGKAVKVEFSSETGMPDFPNFDNSLTDKLAAIDPEANGEYASELAKLQTNINKVLPDTINMYSGVVSFIFDVNNLDSQFDDFDWEEFDESVQQPEEGEVKTENGDAAVTPDPAQGEAAPEGGEAAAPAEENK